MNLNTLDFSSMLLASPFLAIAMILVHFFVRRSVWKWKKRLGWKHLGFCPSVAALGMVFLFAQAYSRPSLAHVIEAKQDEDVEEDDEGEPETVNKQLSRQLKRIRKGEVVDRLVLRL
jgi:beta-lactamase regulating signal transducer with metallopeptidase domain